MMDHGPTINHGPTIGRHLRDAFYESGAIKFFMIEIGLVLSIFVLSGCDTYRQYEDYNVKTEADLVLTPSGHPHGFGKSECFICHHPENIHQANRLGALSFDLADTLVKESGLRSCSGCHGHNGVSQ